MKDKVHALLEEGTVVQAHESCLAVEVDGVELYVGPTVERSACDCCGDITKLEVSYNLTRGARREKHGEVDPLGLE